MRCEAAEKWLGPSSDASGYNVRYYSWPSAREDIQAIVTILMNTRTTNICHSTVHTIHVQQTYTTALLQSIKGHQPGSS